MERKIGILSREDEIREIMRTTNLMRVEAAAVVAGRFGEDVSDIVGIDGPLTEEERRRLGLGHSLLELIESESGDSGIGR